ncbi:MAG: YfcC family protein [Bacillota bacterium]
MSGGVAAAGPARAPRRFHFPHPLALLAACIALAAALTWVLPAGRYERRVDPATGRSVVVPGTFQRVEARPVGPFQALVAVPKGLADAGSVVFLVFLVGGAFAVVDRTGALRQAVGRLAHLLARRETLVIPVACVAFAVGGIVENMQEEIIAFVPILLLLTRRLGFDAVTAVAMSLGAAAVGAAFSPVNPFQTGIAQKLAQLPQLSAWPFRVAVLVPALALWIWGTMRYAARTRTIPEGADDAAVDAAPLGRNGLILLLVLATFVVLVIGILRLGWDFDQMSALFFLMGVLAGLIGGLGVSGTGAAFADGFGSMAGAAMLIGFARAISVVLEQGQVLDTIVHGLFTPIAGLPLALSAIGMAVMHTAIHVPVPSVSGQAVLTMPILVPLSDLLGLSRQMTVFAYQIGAGLCDLITPTNGGLMAIIAAAGVPYDRWIGFATRIYLALFALGLVALGIGIALGV